MQIGGYILNTSLRHKLLSESIAPNPPPHAKDMRRLDFGIELNVVAASAPDVTRVAEKIVHLIEVTFHRTKLIDWYIDIGMLFAIWIKIHDDKNDVVARGRHLAVKQNRVIISVIEAKVVVKHQGLDRAAESNPN